MEKTGGRLGVNLLAGPPSAGILVWGGLLCAPPRWWQVFVVWMFADAFIALLAVALLIGFGSRMKGTTK